MRFVCGVIARVTLGVGYIVLALVNVEQARDLAFPYAAICLVIAINDLIHIYLREKHRGARSTHRQRHA